MKRNITIFYISAFCSEFMLWIPFIVLYATRDIGMTFSQYMITEIIFSIAVIILEVPTGLVSDYFSRKLSWILGSMFLVLGALTFAIMSNFWYLLLTQIFFAFWVTFHSGSNEALIYDTLKLEGKEDEYTQVLSKQKAIKGISALIASLLGGFIIAFTEIKSLFYIYPIFTLVAFFTSFLLMEPQRQTKGEESKLFDILKESVKVISTNKKVFPLVMFMGIVPAFTKAVFWLITPLQIRLGIDEVYWGGISSLNRFIGIILLIILPYILLKIRVSQMNKIVVGSLFLGTILLFVKSSFIAIPAIILIINMRFIIQVIGNDELNNMILSQNRATVLSFVGVVSSVIFAVGSFFSTSVFDAFGYEISLIAMALVFLIPTIFFYYMHSKNKDI